ncbi:MAG: response regulator transcription factor [Chloroflexi bacterium]|nr:response regulator transcription factor [Chloroflexota bacterium]MBU1747433.1 response regulator transcription factor [Chloroflexota bacterium]MBU1880007.1 response regulator transcription factor [Chloroflexota bacterium]
MSAIRVLLAEDHTLVRKGLRALLDAEPDIEVVGEAADGRAAVEQVGQLQPDLVLMDLSMPSLNGLEATRQIRRRCPKVQVVVLTMHADEEYIFQILRAGAAGYVVKKAAPSELIAAIQTVYRGETYLSPAVSRTVIQEYIRRAAAMEEADDDNRLTPREREVLQLIAEGRANREIAALLHLSVKTVETHRANLMAKLDRHSVAALTQYAIRKGVIDPA